jgi:hypothetical protein
MQSQTRKQTTLCVDAGVRPLERRRDDEHVPQQVLWEWSSERLEYRFGPWSLGEKTFRSLTLATHPFTINGTILVPIRNGFSASGDVVACRALPVGRDLPVLRFCDGAIRYIPRHGDRYVIDLAGSFTDYLKRFSKKSRGNIQRSVRKLADPKTREPDLRVYQTAREISDFRQVAIAISHRSYKQAAGIGFTESLNFEADLKKDAENAVVRGYALFYLGRPISYVFCRVYDDVIVYKHIGYSNEFSHLSPGTALLYLIIEQLFNERKFRLLDFDSLEYYSYKEYFATRSIRCAHILWFRPTLRNLLFIIPHWVVSMSWQAASAVRYCLRKCVETRFQLFARRPLRQRDVTAAHSAVHNRETAT